MSSEALLSRKNSGRSGEWSQLRIFIYLWATLRSPQNWALVYELV